MDIYDSAQGNITDVYFNEKDIEQHKGPLLLQIFIMEISEMYPSYLVRLEYSISHPLNKNNFRLLTREEIIISELLGEKIYYSYDISSSNSKLDMIGIVAYFDDADYLWEIKLISPSIDQEQILDEFDHILETFQILD